MLFVKLADDVALTDELQADIRDRAAHQRIATPRARRASRRCREIPRTRSNKISELAVADVVNGREVRNTEALANPESFDAVQAIAPNWRTDG